MKSLVVVPIRNGERFLADTLESLLNQTVRPDEIICIDDASTDRSIEVVEGFGSSRIHLLRNTTRLGLSGNWNRALDLAGGYDFLTIVHQDDIYEPPYLEKVTSALDSRPSAFIAHTKASIIDEDGFPTRLASAKYKEKFWTDQPIVERSIQEELQLLIRGDYIFCPSVTFRSSSIGSIGDFDARFEFVTDWDFWLRGLLTGFTIIGINERLIRYRSHAGSATNVAEKTLRRYREEIEIVDHYGEIARSSKIQLRVDYRAAENTLSDGVVRLLEAGKRDEARKVLQFGKKKIPGFQFRPIAILLSALIPFGRLGGGLLRAGMLVYFFTARGPR